MRNAMFVADAHAPIFSKPTRLYGRNVHFTVDDLIKRMDTTGVDAAVVITRPTTQLPIVELKALHDDVAASVAKYADRLVGFAWAAPRLGDAGVAEVRRCLKDLRFEGVKLHSGQEQFNIDDPDVAPYLKLAREFKVPGTVPTPIAIPGAEPWPMVRPAQAYPD